MNVINDEVFAVILALTVVGSVIPALIILRPEVTEPFTSIGLLNSECKIGDYPSYVIPRDDIDLCIQVFNYMGYPILAQVRYKVGTAKDLPTNTIPSALSIIKNITVIVPHNAEKLVKARFPVIVDESMIGKNATLIFELWIYDNVKNEWVYSGEWVHLHVRVAGVPLT